MLRRVTIEQTNVHVTKLQLNIPHVTIEQSNLHRMLWYVRRIEVVQNYHTAVCGVTCATLSRDISQHSPHSHLTTSRYLNDLRSSRRLAF